MSAACHAVGSLLVAAVACIVLRLNAESQITNRRLPRIDGFAWTLSHADAQEVSHSDNFSQGISYSTRRRTSDE